MEGPRLDVARRSEVTVSASTWQPGKAQLQSASGPGRWRAGTWLWTISHWNQGPAPYKRKYCLLPAHRRKCHGCKQNGLACARPAFGWHVLFSAASPIATGTMFVTCGVTGGFELQACQKHPSPKAVDFAKASVT